MYDETYGLYIAWNMPDGGTLIVNGAVASASTTTYSSGGYTYVRGAFVSTYTTFTGYSTSYGYYVSRQQTGGAINTSVPASGTISLSQFYGVHNP